MSVKRCSGILISAFEICCILKYVFMRTMFLHHLHVENGTSASALIAREEVIATKIADQKRKFASVYWYM